jgi:hypothetical protein
MPIVEPKRLSCSAPSERRLRRVGRQLDELQGTPWSENCQVQQEIGKFTEGTQSTGAAAADGTIESAHFA